MLLIVPSKKTDLEFVIKLSNTKLYIYLIGAQALAVLKQILGICRSQQYPECTSLHELLYPWPTIGVSIAQCRASGGEILRSQVQSLWEIFSTTKLLDREHTTHIVTEQFCEKSWGILFNP